ncbi:aminotransferase class IV [Saccharothrix coeruleofusca]|uniref:Branched chain amino acid aminotransferase n=1 Tax=Saccharothrix coeruleofusca TaxID=33919 RepID=A0A918ARN3_9PSEU|nr:aminotransferase class IV [Saccharothrix coeruleofusca]GGP76184.1 branched chain amino acid aminotransferase [Saccharothrix coeruleofusca]
MPADRPDRVIWRNGEFIPWNEAVVHVNAVGHASVSAAFEGVHSYWSPQRGQLLGFRFRDHMQRMLDSLRLSWLAPPFDADELVAAAVELLRRVSEPGRDVYVRPWGFAAGLHREQMVPAGTPAEIVIDSWDFESKLGRGRTCTLAVSSWPRFNTNASPATMKVFANYHNGRLGTIDARRRGADWPIFTNGNGEVTESSGACIAVIKDGVVATPDLSSGVLDSITRRTVLQLAEEAGIPTQTRRIDRTELYLADEIFLVGTAAEILPAVEVDGFPIGTGQAGPVTRQLEAAYHDVVRGVVDSHEEWLVPVERARVAG